MRLFGIVIAAALLVTLTACNEKPTLSSIIDQIKKPTKLIETPEAAQPTPVPPPKSAKKTTHHGKKPDPKPAPSQQELVEYLRGKLLALSPSDGINDNLDVVFNPATTALTTTQPNGRCEQFINALDANSVSWDIFDASDTHSSREELLRLTVTSLSGKTARSCYDKENRRDKTVNGNRARFLFSLPKVQQFPGFQDKMTKAVKDLIVQSGGAAEKPLY